MMDIQSYLQMALTACNLIVIVFTLKKLFGAPHNDLVTRVANLETKVSDLERSINANWDTTREQKETMEVIQNCILALIDFELSYCSHTNYKEDVSDLEEAKMLLRKHLAKK